MPTATLPFVDAATSVTRSTLVGGFNHVATITHDLDRLVAFYRDMFDVPFVPIPVVDRHPLRHGFLVLGAATANGGCGPVLHVFEANNAMTGPFPEANAMFRRGRLDHIAIEARDEHALAEVRDRLVAAGASDGIVRVMGGHLLSVHVEDPDGMELEIACRWTGEHFRDADVVHPA